MTRMNLKTLRITSAIFFVSLSFTQIAANEHDSRVKRTSLIVELTGPMGYPEDKWEGYEGTFQPLSQTVALRGIGAAFRFQNNNEPDVGYALQIFKGSKRIFSKRFAVTPVKFGIRKAIHEVHFLGNLSTDTTYKVKVTLLSSSRAAHGDFFYLVQEVNE